MDGRDKPDHDNLGTKRKSHNTSVIHNEKRCGLLDHHTGATFLAHAAGTERPRKTTASGMAHAIHQPCRERLAGTLVAAALAVLFATPALAQRIENSVAVFAALDKVTAKISRLEVPLNQTATFGALKVTPRACYSRAPTEPPKTTTFVEVEETQLDGKEKRIFSGWMFA